MAYGYKNLLSYPQFLKVKQRAKALVTGTDLLAIDYKDRRLIFKTKSGSRNGIIHTQTIEISDLTLENLYEGFKYANVEDLIRKSGLRVHCTCEAFTYWGFKYVAWKKGYGLVRESRPPTVRNPYQVESVCKHLYLVLQTYPFWSKALASRFKNWYDAKYGRNWTLPDVKYTSTFTRPYPNYGDDEVDPVVEDDTDI